MIIEGPLNYISGWGWKVKIKKEGESMRRQRYKEDKTRYLHAHMEERRILKFLYGNCIGISPPMESSDSRTYLLRPHWAFSQIIYVVKNNN